MGFPYFLVISWQGLLFTSFNPWQGLLCSLLWLLFTSFQQSNMLSVLHRTQNNDLFHILLSLNHRFESSFAIKSGKISFQKIFEILNFHDWIFFKGMIYTGNTQPVLRVLWWLLANNSTCLHGSHYFSSFFSFQAP